MEQPRLRHFMLLLIVAILSSCGFSPATPKNIALNSKPERSLSAVTYTLDGKFDPSCSEQYIEDGPVVFQANQIKLTTRALPPNFSQGWIGIFQKGSTDGQYRAWKWVSKSGGEVTFDLTSLLQASLISTMQIDIRFFCGGEYTRSPYLYEATVKL